VRVRLCFLVNVRKASGRSVPGGSSIGRTVALGGGFSAGGARIAVTLRGLMGCAGVPKAGDDEGIGFAGTAEGFSGLLAVAIMSPIQLSWCCTFDVVHVEKHFTARRVCKRAFAVVRACDSSSTFSSPSTNTTDLTLALRKDTDKYLTTVEYPIISITTSLIHTKSLTMADPAAQILAAVDETEEIPRTQEKLDELKTTASIHYSTKNFPAAAENYAHAVEIQDALNGEMAPENAELLFYYGRALYKVAVAKSDVLGNKVAQEDKKKKKSKKAAKAEAEASSATGGKTEPKEESVDSKPFFQLTGDENWTDSEDEDDEADGEEEEEDDDFGNAYETFELARVLYSKQLEALEGGETADKGKGKGKAELSPKARAIKEKIADCHGFLVDISLENERFHDAISDARAALSLQEELKPFEHENITEGHYSLSLALEFASVHKVREDQTGKSSDATAEEAEADDSKDSIDWDLRNEAAKHTELAIQSLQARLKKEEAALSLDTLTLEEKKEKQAIVEDKKGMLEELTTRVTDLKADPTKQEIDSIDPTVFQGLLGGLLGADAATQKAKIAEATKSANDVSGMVKKKAKPAPAPAQAGGSGKRKLEVDGKEADGKRAKTEEPAT
jgi:HAT1-interacting factor 1